jgi:hypothetical protein
MLFNPIRLGFLGIVGLCLSLNFASPTYAETCEPLNVVGADGISVKKTVSPFSTLVTNNNWNTDFAVPSDRSYNRYVATIVPENNANYDIELNLKYSDNSSGGAYKKDNVAVKVGQPLRLVGVPRSRRDPFQVNVFIGGLNAIGNTYTVSVDGCI